MTTILSWAGKFWLYMSGWKIAGNPLATNKFVLVVAFHTSNWDFTTCVATRLALKAPVSWIGKHTIFWGPLGPLMRLTGGVPVNRGFATDMVGQVAAKFREVDRFGVALFPEGTRKRVRKWKTGFYQIALQAGVPIQPGVLDYRTKTFRFGPLFYPSGDYQFDMEFLKPFFRTAVPKYPANADMDYSTSPN